MPAGNLQASKHGKSWNDAGDVGGKGPACLQVGNRAGMPAGWESAGMKIREMLE